ncbi:secretin N-terminal domain-containing protein, partial [Aeromonas sp. HMWF015]|uniref:secretin N-terminal domain-containing protein n=1 Tax=Aeromonas sp. HMWF015 TaxID=2056851 RepID=UPI000D4E97D4
MNAFSKILTIICASSILMSEVSLSAEFTVGFKNADIQEFINTVSKNLEKTIIIEPSVRGNINVRSYGLLNEEQYYQFFLSVLEVYGFAVVPMDNGVIKVIRSKDASTSAVPLVDDNSPGIGDELVTRVVSIYNIPVNELVSVLRQMNDNSGGYVVHHDQTNALLITGRAAVVTRLVNIINHLDKSRNQDVETIRLKFASAGEVIRIIESLYKDKSSQNTYFSQLRVPKLAADERTNSIMVSGEERARSRVIKMISTLDQEQPNQGNTRVFYLKYGKAKDMLEVIKGVGSSLESDKKGGG